MKYGKNARLDENTLKIVIIIDSVLITRKKSQKMYHNCFRITL
jgi:hypothetical protein